MINKKIVLILIAINILFIYSYGYRKFLYISREEIFSVEIISENKVLFNFVNLSEFAKVIEASQIFLYKEKIHRVCLGQVFEENENFSASCLAMEWSSCGNILWGKFKFSEKECSTFYIYRGGVFYQLEGVGESEFDYLRMLIEKLDLYKKNIKTQFYKLGIPYKGKMFFEEERKNLVKIYENSFVKGVNPPKILKSIPINCPDKFKDTCKKIKNGKLLIEGIINKKGEIKGIKIISHIKIPEEYKIYIINFIKLNFSFLPATLNGDIVAAKVKFKVKLKAN